MKDEKKILVIGSTGKTGKRVLQRLTNAGAPVLGVTHSTTPKFDWNDSTTWEEVLRNIKSVYISFYPDVAIPGTFKTIAEFTEMAVQQGIQKLVLLSGRGEEEARLCENVVMNAGADWTIIRASWFCQNFSQGFLLEPILSGHLALPAGDVTEPFVDADDIADVAVAALTDEKHNGKLYEVTGPRLLSFRQAVQEIAEATGHRINFEKISMSAYSAALKEHGLPNQIIELITYLFTEVLDGRNENLTDGVEQALGRKATDFSEFVKKAAAAGAWKQSFNPSHL